MQMCDTRLRLRSTSTTVHRLFYLTSVVVVIPHLQKAFEFLRGYKLCGDLRTIALVCVDVMLPSYSDV